jgi:hypothetical protein
VSYRTTRRLLPKPLTYAFSADVRREASATSTSSTGTPSCSASASTCVRSGPSGREVKELKTGSTTSG